MWWRKYANAKNVNVTIEKRDVMSRVWRWRDARDTRKKNQKNQQNEKWTNENENRKRKGQEGRDGEGGHLDGIGRSSDQHECAQYAQYVRKRKRMRE